MPARILIVDDNRESLYLMRYLLEASGYATLGAADGQQALELVRCEHPDLVLCDIHMPVVDGFAFAQQVCGDAALAHIPLIAVTASAMVGDRNQVLAAGFRAYFSKPIEPESFVAALEQWLPAAARGAR